MKISKLIQHARSAYRRIRRFVNNPRLVRGQYDSNSPLEYTIGQNEYGRYCVPVSSSDRLAAQKVLSGDVYEPDTIEFMTSSCADGDIVHAGAYFGDFIPALSKACASHAKVWAFEPNPENFRCARITIDINELDNVKLTNAGLGEQRESLTMLTKDEHGRALGGRSRLINIDENILSGIIETIQIVSIDEIIPRDRNVSIIQLDVEGHEKQALAGALETIQRCLPIIIVEAYSDELFESKWFSDNFLRLGYKIHHKVHNNTILFCDQ